jgi:acyl carrier protein
MQPESLDEVVLAQVCGALARLDRRMANRPMTRDTSVVDDLGIDSLRFVDLTVILEEQLQIREFPLQDWYDSEAQKSGKRFTVGSLVSLCTELMSESASNPR